MIIRNVFQNNFGNTNSKDLNVISKALIFVFFPFENLILL